mgnify:CR=1 FL=1
MEKNQARKKCKNFVMSDKKKCDKRVSVYRKKRKIIVQKKVSVRLKKNPVVHPQKKQAWTFFLSDSKKKKLWKKVFRFSISSLILKKLNVFPSSVHEKKREKEIEWKKIESDYMWRGKKNKKREKKWKKKRSPIQSIYIYLIKKFVWLPGYSFRPSKKNHHTCDRSHFNPSPMAKNKKEKTIMRDCIKFGPKS